MYNPYQQQFGFNPQQTGYSGGFNNQQQQFQQFQQPYQQQPLQSQPTNFYQPGAMQQTGYGMAPQLQTQQTGYLQSQPNVLPSSGFSVSSGLENSSLKIPDIRLSFITAEDQKKYEHLFRTAVQNGEQAISGDSASEILLRSGLPPVTLAEIWSLSDTNKTGSLLFPEFALSLHLSSMAKRNESIPASLPDKWQNEVKSFVDAINFSIPEDPAKILANTPFSKFNSVDNSGTQQFQPQATGFNNLNNTGNNNEFIVPQVTGFQPQSSFGQALNAQRTGGNQLQSQQNINPLVSQRTGGGTLIPLQAQQTAGLIPVQKTGSGGQPSLMAPQRTGMNYQSSGMLNQNTGLKPQLTGFQPQRTGLQPQQTGSQSQQPGLQSQSTGFQPQQTGLQPQSTGFQYQQTGFQPQQTGYQAALTQQPTGRPGEWGFISAPTGGIPGLNMMESHFLPESTQSSNNLQNAMGGNQKSNVTWAITKEEKQIYDGIFTAWDKAGNGYMSGETALSIFGKSGLSRADLESIWNLADQNDRGKLNKDEFVVAMHLVYRRLNGLELPLRLPPELIPPSTKYIQESMNSMKNSLKGGKVNPKPIVNKNIKSDGSRYKNDDEITSAYISNSRHRRRTTMSNENASSVKSSQDTNLSVEDLKKLIREKRILLEVNDIEDQDRSLSNKRLESKNFEEIELLKSKIRAVHDFLNQSGSGNVSNNERQQLLQKLNFVARDTVPGLISSINSINSQIVDSKIKLLRLKINKENPNWSHESVIVGTGPNGEVTELDKRKHRSKQLLRQRMNALTGKSNNNDNDDESLNAKYQQESDYIIKDSKDQTDMVKDIESSIKDLEDGCYSFLQSSTKDDVTSDKWEHGNGVSSEVAEFINELKTRKVANNIAVKQNNPSNNSREASQTKSFNEVPSPSIPQSNVSTPTEKYKSSEERSSYIKAQAEKRMNERLAKLGITRNKRSSNVEQESSAKEQGNVKVDQDPTAKPSLYTPPEHKDVEKLVQSSSKETLATPPPVQVSESEDESEDEEYAELLRQKKELESREKERKLKKQQQRELRLAKLKEEMNNLKQKEQLDDYDSKELQDDANTNSDKPVISSGVTPSAVIPSAVIPSAVIPSAVIPSAVTPTVVAASSVSSSSPLSKEQPVNDSNEIKTHSSSNPFANMKNKAPGNTATPSVPSSNIPSSNTQSSTPTSTNPFFKPNNQNTPIDPQKAAAQRISQRGLATDEWSDEEENSSDDEPNREGAAQLASLLFGGMSQGPTKSSSSTPKPESTLVSMQVHSTTSANQSTDEFHTPPNSEEPFDEEEEQSILGKDSIQDYHKPSDVPPIPQAPSTPQAPPTPADAPPVPQAPPAPPIPTDAPPVPRAPPAPPIPTDAPPVPRAPPAPPVPTDAPPVPQAPPAPPAPPAPSSIPPPPSTNSQTSAPNLSALLGQIQLGKSLKKVDESKQRIADGATVGRVL